ncbi:L,D-transpeptidase [bacterium]|nr:L,D-transpeptidase [bacterium]
MRLLFFCLLLGSAWAQPKLRINGEGVEIECPGGCQVWRSTSLQGGPTSQWTVKGNRYQDNQLAHGLDYYYWLSSGGRQWKAGPLRLDWRPLPVSRHPWLRIDKSRYLLSVLEGEKVLKNYALALGRRPLRRKLEFDQASTPEGRYRIIGLQPEATYYKALDIDYPNETDQARHTLLAPHSEIGGEIQIHGMGITSNWTWGCMAMRDQDIDEIFRHSEIGVGTRVWIYGGEVSLAELQADERAGEVDRLALGRRQKRAGQPVTCLSR